MYHCISVVSVLNEHISCHNSLVLPCTWWALPESRGARPQAVPRSSPSGLCYRGAVGVKYTGLAKARRPAHLCRPGNLALAANSPARHSCHRIHPPRSKTNLALPPAPQLRWHPLSWPDLCLFCLYYFPRLQFFSLWITFQMAFKIAFDEAMAVFELWSDRCIKWVEENWWQNITDWIYYYSILLWNQY